LTEVRPYVKVELLDRIQDVYPEARGMSATGVVEWGLRKLIAEAQKGE